MNLMINAVLDYSRIGRSVVLIRPINVGQLINDIIKDLELVYNTTDLRITVGETPELQGDPIMMLQVFSNLLGNAVKYSQGTSPAIIHIEGKKAAEVKSASTKTCTQGSLLRNPAGFHKGIVRRVLCERPCGDGKLLVKIKICS